MTDIQRVLDAVAEGRRRGFLEAVELFRHFGDELTGDKSLSDEEAYILDNAADIIELQAPGTETP